MDELITVPVSPQTQAKLRNAGVDSLDTLASCLIDWIARQDEETQRKILCDAPPSNCEDSTVYTETFLK